MTIKNKKAQGMQFGWLFALIIGAAILFLAVFFSGRLLGTGTQMTQAEISRSLDILLNPFASVSQAEVGLSKPLTMPQKTTINFSCNAAADSERIDVKVELGKAPFPYTIKNKYIFAEDFNTKDLWVFSKPFKMPWKVDDMIYVVSRPYCFINPPQSIYDELNALNSSFIQPVKSASMCKQNSVKVCFTGCTVYDIKVNPDSVKTKYGSLAYVDDATLYAAVFGPKMYYCNMERLLNRLNSQADVFIEKAGLLSERGCTEANALTPEILGLKSAINNAISLKDYSSLEFSSSSIDEKNRIQCPLY